MSVGKSNIHDAIETEESNRRSLSCQVKSFLATRANLQASLSRACTCFPSVCERLDWWRNCCDRLCVTCDLSMLYVQMHVRDAALGGKETDVLCCWFVSNAPESTWTSILTPATILFTLQHQPWTGQVCPCLLQYCSILQLIEMLVDKPVKQWKSAICNIEAQTPLTLYGWQQNIMPSLQSIDTHSI